MSSNQWQIGNADNIDEDEKTRLIGSYKRHKLTERTDEVLLMPENTSIGTETTSAPPSRLPVWAMITLGVVGLLSAGLSAVVLLLWLL